MDTNSTGLESRKQSVFYVVNVVLDYKDFEEARVDAPNDIAAHIARSKELHEKGRLLMSGAFLNNPSEPLTTMAVLASHEAAEEYIKGDPFFKKGMIKNWYIREWANIFAHSSSREAD